MGVTLPASARRAQASGAVSPSRTVAKISRSWPTCSGVSRSNTCLRTARTCPGAASASATKPASVSWARVLRRSSGQGERRTQPLRSSLLTACDSRLCELCVTAARSLIRNVRPGTSESMARMR